MKARCSLNNEAPIGYEENDGHLTTPIPIGNGVYKVAKWVKRLEDGRVAMYHTEMSTEEDPYIVDLMAPYDCDSDSPTEPIAPWFCRLMCVEASKYNILRNEVAKLFDWGHLAEVERYRKLSTQIAVNNDHIEQLTQDIESLRLQRKMCESHLCFARTQKKVGHLEGRYTPYPATQASGWHHTKKPSFLLEQEN